MIVRSDRVTPEKLKWYDQFGPYAWICYEGKVLRMEYDIQTINDAHRLLIRKEHHNLIKLQKEPFTYVMTGCKEDWIKYGLQPVYFLVSDVKQDNRWYQPIRRIDLASQKEPYWITEDIEEGIEQCRQIVGCPNCCPDESPWPQAAIAVPVKEIAEHFLEAGWDKRIVDEVILHKEVDWFKQGKLPLDQKKRGS